jgi:hypothetical protein
MMLPAAKDPNLRCAGEVRIIAEAQSEALCRSVHVCEFEAYGGDGDVVVTAQVIVLLAPGVNTHHVHTRHAMVLMRCAAAGSPLFGADVGPQPAGWVPHLVQSAS